MYFLFFIVSLILFIIAVIYGISGILKEISQVEEFYKEVKKRTMIAALMTIVAIALAIVPIIDASTFEMVEREVRSEYGYYTKEYWQQSKYLKVQVENLYDEPSTWYIWILLIGESIYLISRLGKANRETEKEVKRIKRDKDLAEYKTQKEVAAIKAETKAIKFVTERFGKPDKILHTVSTIWGPDWNRTVFFVFDKELMYYNDRVICFNEIISCDCVDNSKVVTKLTGNTTTEISTDTSSMIGRTLVGGVLAGGAGAIVGGVTAKKYGESKTEATSISVTKHDYTIIINTTNVRNPLLKIPCGDCQQVAEDIVATLKAAIAV